MTTDPKFRSHVMGELGNALQKVKDEAGAPQTNQSGGKGPANTARPKYSNGNKAHSDEVLAGVVYLLKAGPFFKIGKTVNMEQRLKQTKLQLPYSVEVVHVTKAAEISHVEGY